MENEDNKEEPMIQIVEVRRAITNLSKIITPDTYNGKSKPHFNSANSDANLKKLGRKVDYLI